MITLINNSNNPFYNLALEEYLLDSDLDEICYLWINEPSVIIGINQNVYNEVNIDYVQKNSINIARRITGGGAVYHDYGNINYTFIGKKEEEGIDFARYTSPIINAINKLGVTACLSGRNDIMIGNTKVSGSAQANRNGKVLHHGCLLYDTDLSMVANTLKVNKEKLKSKGIKSVSSRVANIKTLTNSDMSPIEFKNYLSSSIAGQCGVYSLTDFDIKEINKRVEEKFSTWDWIYGKSKDFENKVSRRFDYGTVEISYKLNNGIIEDIKIMGDFFSSKDVSTLEEAISGEKFIKESVFNILDKINISQYIFGATKEDIMDLLFSL